MLFRFASIGLCLLLSLTAVEGVQGDGLLAPPDIRRSEEQRALSIQTASADSIQLGVVWTPPTDRGPALRELDRIHDAGATAVRLTRPPAFDTLFARADRLDLRLFLDLPVRTVTASALGDSLSRAAAVLDRVEVLARRHSSVQNVGLARQADTAVPRACSTLADWTQRLADRTPGLNTYYVTPFPPAVDRCADAVDHLLLDVRGRDHPLDRWRQWADHTGPVGLGALGTWVHPSADSGLQVPHSPQRQARYLERHLSTVLDSLRPPPSVVFAYRWADRSDPEDGALLSSRRYGLHTADGTRRPAGDVVSGMYTGAQRVFAFPAGTAPAAMPHGPILLGWLLFAVLGGLYARSLFVRQTVFRYFVAHGFYRDAVRTRREIDSTRNLALLLVAAAALGLVATLVARILQPQPAAAYVVEALPPALGGLVAGALDHPALTGLVVAGVATLTLSGWAGLLALPAGQQTTLTLDQGLMLVVWPCWPILGGMIGALVAATAPPVAPGLLVGLLLGGGFIAAVLGTARVLFDYRSVSGASTIRVAALAVLNPLVLFLLLCTVVVVQYDVPLAFLWRLALHT